LRAGRREVICRHRPNPAESVSAEKKSYVGGFSRRKRPENKGCGPDGRGGFFILEMLAEARYSVWTGRIARADFFGQGRNGCALNQCILSILTENELFTD